MIKDVMRIFNIKDYVYDPIDKVLIIYEKVPVNVFVRIKYYTKNYVDNHIVKTDRTKRLNV